MKKSSNYKYHFLFVFAVLYLPMLSQFFEWNWVAPLKGYQVSAKYPDFNTTNFINGKWQQGIENHRRERLQFRPLLIRLNNQIKYSLFNSLNAKSIKQGKNNYLFEFRYITSYLGTNFIGTHKLRQNVQQLAELRDSLASHDVHFQLIIAAGKGFYMPENIPARLLAQKQDSTNYEAMLPLLDAYKIDFLDFNNLLIDQKATSQYPLFTKGNTHWSFYAIADITDTLISHLENRLGKNLPAYQRASLRQSTKPRYYTEQGIFNSLNLLWTDFRDTFYYRDLEPKQDTSANYYRPKVWVVGDSFYGTLRTYQVPQYFFDSTSLFLYYNKIVHPQKGRQYRVNEIKNYKEQLKAQDVIIFFVTEASLQDAGWGAASKMLDSLKMSS